MNVRTNCPRCGPVVVKSRDVLLTIHPILGNDFDFTCPRCGAKCFGSQLDGLRTAALVRAAVRVVQVQVPDEAVEILLGRTDDPPIGYDDVLDFALWIEGADLVAAAFAPV